ncbi:trans-sialidase [Trypanosoma cruzi]|nr:trans-sialidase [Trypanosoma cruzi]
MPWSGVEAENARTRLWLRRHSRGGRTGDRDVSCRRVAGVNVAACRQVGIVNVEGAWESADCFQPRSCTCRSFSLAVDPLTEDPPAVRGDVRRRRSGSAGGDNSKRTGGSAWVLRRAAVFFCISLFFFFLCVCWCCSVCADA